MENITTRRVVFGTFVTLLLFGFAGMFAYLAFLDPLNDRGQSVFWPLLSVSLLIFLAAMLFIVFTILAVQGKILITPRQNAIFFQRSAIAMVICLSIASILGWLDAALKFDIVSLCTSVGQLGVINGIFLRNRMKARQIGSRLVYFAGLSVILGLMLLVPAAIDQQYVYAAHAPFVVVELIGIAIILFGLVCVVWGALQFRSVAKNTAS